MTWHPHSRAIWTNAMLHDWSALGNCYLCARGWLRGGSRHFEPHTPDGPFEELYPTTEAKVREERTLVAENPWESLSYDEAIIAASSTLGYDQKAQAQKVHLAKA